ncbi:unnamed protein product [Prorocentrum cordatum]|uniref:Uncharacterized protein n=1 Tax=Prorocentrum cordatum TaxID=2364126 RepID=A0ABN9VBN0_9DINO|nr:unnamed protein product [Polarella glacialis]
MLAHKRLAGMRQAFKAFRHKGLEQEEALERWRVAFDIPAFQSFVTKFPQVVDPVDFEVHRLVETFVQNAAERDELNSMKLKARGRGSLASKGVYISAVRLRPAIGPRAIRRFVTAAARVLTVICLTAYSSKFEFLKLGRRVYTVFRILFLPAATDPANRAAAASIPAGSLWKRRRVCAFVRNGGKKQKAAREFDWSTAEFAHFVLKFAYVGTDYYGLAWQDSETCPTVEGKLFDALVKTRLIRDRQTCGYPIGAGAPTRVCTPRATTRPCS